MEKENIKDKNEILPIVMMGGLFLLVYALGLLVTAPFQSAGIEPAFENPDDPLNIVYIFVTLMQYLRHFNIKGKFK